MLLHPLAKGTIVKLTVEGIVPEFWNISAIFPLPVAVAGEIPEPPVAVQEYVVFSTFELNVTLACVFEQMVRLAGVAIRSGTGYISTGLEITAAAGEHPAAVGTTENTTFSIA